MVKKKKKNFIIENQKEETRVIPTGGENARPPVNRISILLLFFFFSFLFSAFLIIEFLLDWTGRLCLSFYPDFDKSFLSLQTRRAHGSLSTASTISY